MCSRALCLVPVAYQLLLLAFLGEMGYKIIVMETEAIIGCLVAAGALGGIAGLVWWSRKTIDAIARNGYRTARQTLKELNGGK